MKRSSGRQSGITWQTDQAGRQSAARPQLSWRGTNVDQAERCSSHDGLYQATSRQKGVGGTGSQGTISKGMVIMTHQGISS